MTKILIVEDELLVARLYEKALKSSGFDVIIALGGKEGLEKAKAEKPDLVLLDIMMPDPNGIWVLKKMKADPVTSGIPIVMLTNLSGKYDEKFATERGAVGFWVKKDADLKDLGKNINEIIAKTSSATGTS